MECDPFGHILCELVCMCVTYLPFSFLQQTFMTQKYFVRIERTERIGLVHLAQDSKPLLRYVYVRQRERERERESQLLLYAVPRTRL